MNAAALRQLEPSLVHLGEECDRVKRGMPLPGEPRGVYIVRARLGADDLRTATVRMPGGREAWVVFMETIVNLARLYDEVLRPLQELSAQGRLSEAGTQHPILPTAKGVESPDSQVKEILAGRVLVFLDGLVAAIDLEQFPTRNVAEPKTEESILGPKQAFTEAIDGNIGAIRMRIRDEHLRVEVFEIGRRSRTQVALVYLDDVANVDLIQLTRRGLSAINTDFVRNANDIAEFLFQRSLTTLPLVDQTERVDRVATSITDGRVCLVIDGTPFTLLVPTTFLDMIKGSSEAALPHSINVIFVRIVRLLGMGFAIGGPGLYAALLTADTPLLPTPLALAVSASRNGVPYPVLTETLLMLLIVDIFAEATSQAPGAIGNTLSIVGTLIIGEMAVQARLASSLMMIVVATTALGSFLTLKYSFSYTLRIWKYPIAILGGIGGLFGWMAGQVLLFTHMAALKSAGVPYLSPFGPMQPETLLRQGIAQVPAPFLRRRPAQLDVQDITRMRSRP